MFVKFSDVMIYRVIILFLEGIFWIIIINMVNKLIVLF